MAAASQPVDPSVSRTALPLDAEDLATVCVLCSHNCGLRVDVADGRISAVRPDASNPITEGYFCNKAMAIPFYAHHAQRLQHPLRRAADGSYERIDWDTAIREIAAKLGSIRDEHSPRAIGLAGIGGQANHMDGPFGISFLQSVGSPIWFNALAQEKTQHFLVDQWLFDTSPQVWFHPDIENAATLLVMGTNPRISNRGHNANETFKGLSENPDQRMIVVDPRETETTRSADRHLRAAPGSDAYLLLGLAATIACGEGLADARFVADKVEGFEALRAELAKVDVDEMARRCELSVDEIVETARELATADSAAIMFDLAVEQLPFSTLISYLIRVISVLTGNVGQPGGNTFIETQSAPTRSPRRFEEPPRTLEAGIRAISAIGGFPMFSPTLAPEEILSDHPERIRALIVEGSNPLLSYSDTSRWREACERLDLLVVIEPTWTETAARADYVLPTPVGYEKWEVAGFPKRHPEIHVQLRPPVLPGPAEALPEPEIYVRLVEAMELIPPPPEEIHALAEAALTPAGAAPFLMRLQADGGGTAQMLFWAYRTLGVHLPAPSLASAWLLLHENVLARGPDVLRALGPEWADKNPFELGAELFRRVLAHPEGVEIARCPSEGNLEGHLGHEDGKVHIAPPELVAEVARARDTLLPSDPKYPTVLAAGLRTRWTANTIQRDPKWRKGRGPHCTLHLSPEDADAFGVAPGDRVRVSTRRGSVELPAEIDKKCRAGHVWIPNGFGASYPSGPNGELEVQGVNTNELTDVADRDPISGCPHHKYTLCRVERV